MADAPFMNTGPRVESAPVSPAAQAEGGINIPVNAETVSVVEKVIEGNTTGSSGSSQTKAITTSNTQQTTAVVVLSQEEIESKRKKEAQEKFKHTVQQVMAAMGTTVEPDKIESARNEVITANHKDFYNKQKSSPLDVQIP